MKWSLRSCHLIRADFVTKTTRKAIIYDETPGRVASNFVIKDYSDEFNPTIIQKELLSNVDYLEKEVRDIFDMKQSPMLIKEEFYPEEQEATEIDLDIGKNLSILSKSGRFQELPLNLAKSTEDDFSKVFSSEFNANDRKSQRNFEKGKNNGFCERISINRNKKENVRISFDTFNRSMSNNNSAVNIFQKMESNREIKIGSFDLGDENKGSSEMIELKNDKDVQGLNENEQFKEKTKLENNEFMDFEMGLMKKKSLNEQKSSINQIESDENEKDQQIKENIAFENNEIAINFDKNPILLKKKLQNQKNEQKNEIEQNLKGQTSNIETPQNFPQFRLIKICFLLHGFEGTSFDLRNLRSILGYYLQEYKFVLSESNENNTNESIEQLGLRFSIEVRENIKNLPLNSILEISFIGHSLGGLIVRAALPNLKDFSKNLKTYVSLSTPHLGSCSNRFLVSTGLKMLCRFKNNQSIREMNLSDENNYLQKLNKMNDLGSFQNVILVGNCEDGYVPWESALVMIDYESVNKELTKSMAESFYRQFKNTNIVKMRVYIPNLAKGMDVFLGRQAHVEILENTLLKRVVFSQLREYF